VLVLLVPDVGDPGEAGREGLADRLQNDETLAPRIRPRGPSKTASSAKWARIPSRSCSSKAEVTALNIRIASSWFKTLLETRTMGEGVGKLQRIVYELDLSFAKVGDKLTVKKP
jgi:hypothetical protein